ncbi:GspH/FimT family pseudopilin [Lysobacter soyae]|uniref:Type II secretion system protein H n=1 Tax=Lysobacter soyae TaxID=2764185 RepID=A0ABX8WQF6_9GAMM|nr:GspH/FimT family pseudopilin [Lysobacter sp. CJ11]QYR52537.1 GspH/FimT family pseudopilin [Lysobacter sp. CJ11]
MRSSTHKYKQQHLGFSLVELMVVVALISIIGAIAAPNVVQMTRRARLTNAGNEFVGAMQTARMTAVSRRETVSLCPTADGTTCANSAGTRWIVLTTGNDVVRDINLPPGIAVQGSPNLVAANFRVTFGPSGFSKAGLGAAAPTTATLAVCGSNITGINAMDVTSSMGRVTTARRAATAACANPGEN